MASYYSSIIILFILALLLLISTSSSSSSSKRHLCLTQQQNALLQFENSFGMRILSWNNDTDCCTWDGVTCDDRTGDVIGLDISYIGLRGTINNGSSLFLLQNLQNLNLAHNALSGSLIFYGQFSSLMHLDLSFNGFSGIIPREISRLSQLIFLNLSGNNLTFTSSILELLIKNLTHIQELNLEGVRIDGGFCGSLLNLSTTLTSLTLSNCNLNGKFPHHIFHLPNLRILSASENLELTGTLPKLNWSSPLISLDLSSTGFSGNIPNSIVNLKNLENLNLHSCSFTHLIPSSICSLSSLQVLVLSDNKFSSLIPQCLGKLTNLQHLDMSLNQLTGPLPRSLNNCTLLEHAIVNSNMLNDTSPLWLGRLPNLSVLDLGQNSFYGPIGRSYTGSILSTLILCQNGFSGHLPDFHGHLSLKVLDLSSNNLEGSIPRLPQFLSLLLLSNNNFTGEIPLSICKFLPVFLDMSNNSFTGPIPPCLPNRGHVINLGMNKLEGAIPDIFEENTSMVALNLSWNQVRGPLPRSMVNCKELVLLDLSNNNIEDSFPNWLETVSNLQVLVLKSNRFNGKLKTVTDHPFPNLRMFDISNNNLTGILPIEYISQLDAMKNGHISQSCMQYLDAYDLYIDHCIYFLRISLMKKGSRFEFSKISNALTSIDFSSNNFQGEVPEVIGELVALTLLNLSHNNFTGSIPLSFQNLTSLELLDLSSNKLNGLIPNELAHLTELSDLNLSYNELSGMIPIGGQFDTFGMDSFLGNTGLCGIQLAKACGELDILEQQDLKNWQIGLMGYGSGLVIGISIEYMVFELRRPKWFVILAEENLLRKIVRSQRWRT